MYNEKQHVEIPKELNTTKGSRQSFLTHFCVYYSNLYVFRIIKCHLK
jgi:hypothetical protein